MPYERQTKLSYKNLANFLHVTNSLLCSFFSDSSSYSSGEKLFYECICPNSVEDFISGEIFSEGIIRISSQTELATDKKVFCMLSLAYLLHCRFNYKMDRCNPDFYSCKAFDLHLYKILCYSAWKNCFQWEKRDKELCRETNFFDNFLKLSFRFCDPSGIEHTWRGSQYSISEGHQFEVKSGFNYGSHMRFLLSNNPIHWDFGKKVKSTRVFWNTYVKLGRGNEPYRLEDGCTAEIDLLIFALCLGLSEDGFNKLASLRKEAYPNRTPINPDTPAFLDETEKEAVINRMHELLRDSKQRLEKLFERARSKDIVLAEIPRIILMEVNEDLKSKLNFTLIP